MAEKTDDEVRTDGNEQRKKEKPDARETGLVE